jgi:hypothetical protein
LENLGVCARKSDERVTCEVVVENAALEDVVGVELFHRSRIALEVPADHRAEK